MKKQIAMLLVCAVFLFSLAGCTAKHKYNANDYLGKTSAQIEEEYGKLVGANTSNWEKERVCVMDMIILNVHQMLGNIII